MYVVIATGGVELDVDPGEHELLTDVYIDLYVVIATGGVELDVYPGEHELLTDVYIYLYVVIATGVESILENTSY